MVPILYRPHRLSVRCSIHSRELQVNVPSTQIVVSRDGTVIEMVDCIIVTLTDDQIERLEEEFSDNERMSFALAFAADSTL